MAYSTLTFLTMKVSSFSRYKAMSHVPPEMSHLEWEVDRGGQLVAAKLVNPLVVAAAAPDLPI